MARYDRPEKRIRRILNSATIPSAVTHWGIAAILGFAASALYLAAAASPQSVPRPVAIPNLATPQLANAQDKTEPVALTEFEVASIKPVQPNVPHMVGLKVYRGGRVVIPTASLKSLIATAFGVSYWQISGGDEWVGKDEYNVEANPSESMRSSIKDFRYTLFGIEDGHLREMLQALLIDRFQLKFHRETKSGDVYLLERNGKTLPLRSVADASTGERWERSSASSVGDSFGSIGYAGGQWTIFGTSMPQLAKYASDFVFHVPVVDRTELSGSFDYRQRQPDIDPVYSGDQSPSFKSYLDEAGLKLQRSTGPVEMFVIDHAAKPSPN